MNTRKYVVDIVLLTDMLGTVPKDPAVYETYIKSLGTDNDDEMETVPDNREEKGWTGFHQNENGPIIYDYLIKGFFKDACGMLRRAPGSHSSKLTAFKKIIDGLVFVEPRQIPIVLNGELKVIERPLRAQTAQGERVTLARSDAAPAGSKLSFTLSVLGNDPSEDTLLEWFEYGQLRGLGQWRNSGAGRFELVGFVLQ